MSEVGKSKEKLKNIDFMKGKTKICRICMLGCIKGFISLFTVCDGSGKIYDKIMDVCNIMITSDDGLPKWICYSCLVHLETSYQFKMQAEKSDKLLRQQLTMEDSPSEMNDVYIIDKDDLIKHNSGIINQTTFLQNILTTNNSSNATFSDPSISTHPLVESNDVEQSSDLVIPDDVNVETSNELNSIQITNVVSQAPIEEVEMTSSGDIDKETYNSSEIIDDPLHEPSCTCAESGTSTTKCASCFKISRVGTPEDISYSSSFKSREEIMNDDQIIREVCEKLVLTVELCSRNHVNTVSSNFDIDHFETYSRKQDTNLERFRCGLCDKKFSYQKFLEKHIFTNHRGYKPYTCDMCEYRTHIRKYLVKHKRSAHFKIKPFTCEKCNKGYFLEEELLKHVKYHDYELKCDVCNKVCSGKTGLASHMSMHRNSKEYSCKHCDKVFKLKAALNIHEHSHGMDCKICNKKFYSLTGLKKHITSVHSTASTEFTCEICGKSFKLKSSLSSHLITHTLDSCICDICGGKYPHKRALKIHQRIVHSSKKLIKCKICYKSIKFNTFNNHMKRHSNGKIYKCDLCDVRFSQKTAKKTHMDGMHFGLETYLCENCNVTFKWKSSFYKHRSKCFQNI